MAFGICRVRNLTAGDIRSTEIHNGREYGALGLALPENIDPQKCIKGYHSHSVTGEAQTIEQAINNRLQALNIKPRANSVVALEYVIALTGGAKEKADMWQNYSESGFLMDATRWIAERHGGMQNVASISMHYDESNPHAHIVVLPIIEKTVKWKNQNGQGERVENRLCARDYTGHPDKLRQLQDDYFKFIEPYGEKMGVKFYRGTKKEEQLKQYTEATDHELGKLRAKLDTIKDLAEAKVLLLEIEAKKAEFEKKQGELGRVIELHKEQNRTNEKWKQNKDFDKGF